MSKLTVEDTSLVAVADAIRSKSETRDSLVFPDGFVDAIGNIQTEDNSLLLDILSRTIVEITPDMLKGMTKLGSGSFYACMGLVKAVLPDTITLIDSSVFYYCIKLSYVHLSEEATEIGASALNTCSSLTDLTIPSKVNKIGSGTIYNCKNLTTITMKPTNPPTIATSSIGNNANLTTIIVPKGTLEAYQSATNWSAYADIMVEEEG